MIYSQDYLDDLLVRMAYHSSGIEGNTISLPETVSIILESTLPGKHKSIREFYEIENHKQAFQALLFALDNGEELSLGLVKDIHALLMDRLQHDRGSLSRYKTLLLVRPSRLHRQRKRLFLCNSGWTMPTIAWGCLWK